MMPLNKRGQMTLFIIAGVVILFAAFFIGYLQNESFRQRVESQLFGVSVVPEQAKGVVSYINNCVENIAVDGIELLGFQGGYIEIPKNINSKQYLQADPLTKIPYWIYGNKVVVPSPQQMELQLENYINRRANAECDFYEFSDFEFNNEEIISDVKIADGGVFVILKSDIEVNIKDNVYSLADYIGVNIPVDLKLLYNMGVDIVNREIRSGRIGNAPFERAALELIASYSKDEDSDIIDIPPIAKFDYSCNPKTWIMEDVKEDVKEILSDGMRFLRVKGAENFDYGGNYINLVIDDVSSRNYDNVFVDFYYNKDWPIFLDIYPRNGAVLKPDTMKLGLPFLPLFCYTTYNFRYSVQYPLMANLEKDGFLFRFPVEVSMIDNYAGRSIEGEQIDTDFGDRITRFCDDDQRLSESVNVVTIDAITGRPLGDVQVLYVCGVNSCAVGDTKLEDNEARLNKKFPLCFNGEVRLNKEGYGGFSEGLTTLDSGEKRVFGVMKPLMEKEIELRVIELENGAASERRLKENEVASVQFNIFENGIIKDQTGIVFEGDGVGKIELLPEQEYNVLINLILDDKVIIPKSKYQGQEIPSQEIDNVLLGGADFDVFISENDLLNNDKIIIFALSNGIPQSYEEYAENFDARALSGLHRDKLELRFE